MKRVIILVPVFVILVWVFFSGCTSGPGTETPATPSPAIPLTTVIITEPPTIPVTTPSPIPTTERIRKLPSERQVNLVLTKDRPTSEIHLLYQGGPGEISVNRIMMRVYSSDTVYQEYIMSNGRKPIPGDEIIAPGTRSGDRCEVFVISAGTRYKVMDEAVYGGMYY
jgi:hypothetical protein